MEKLFSPEEVAEYLNVKPEAVRIWLRTAKIRGSKLGNIWRIPESAVTEFLASKENRPPAKENISHKEDRVEAAGTVPETIEEPFSEETELPMQELPIQSDDFTDQPEASVSKESDFFHEPEEAGESVEQINTENSFIADSGDIDESVDIDVKESEVEQKEESADFQDSLFPKEEGEETLTHPTQESETLKDEESKDEENVKEEEKKPVEEKDKLRAVFDQFDPFD